MKTTDTLTQWATFSLDEIEALLATPAGARAARKMYGATDVAAMRAAPARAAIGPRAPVVLLPGITGSLLASIRGVTALLWINPAIFLAGQGNYLDLNADASAVATAVPSCTCTRFRSAQFAQARC
ncbi:MAG: hypothetical protein FJ011_21465 [Chloroflexi bacterium]|nr:hypothetical protein [Chloroflexota bacterium]